MSIRKVRGELVSLLNPLIQQYGTIFAGNPIAERTRLDELASSIVAGTLSRDEVAVLIAAIRPEPQFWRSTLGQHLYYQSGGQPEGTDAVSAPTAAHVLGVVRQRIDQYVMTGQLKRVPDLPVRVSAQSLLDLWTSRNPGGPS